MGLFSQKKKTDKQIIIITHLSIDKKKKQDDKQQLNNRNRHLSVLKSYAILNEKNMMQSNLYGARLSLNCFSFSFIYRAHKYRVKKVTNLVSYFKFKKLQFINII